ncbi:alcohol dehydrogenase catalytic domain-containing protein [Leptospira sp. 96542]|nr:alcohol dehydrogenase catalytic domain-containing protein [Leptospira sp. 96542]
MKQLVFKKKSVLEWEEKPNLGIQSQNQAIVEPLAIARCDLDLPIIHGKTLFRAPFPIGHEFVGQIKSISDDLIHSFPVGTKVVVPFQISCGICPSCSNFHTNSCESVPYTSAFGMPPGAGHFGGALSEEILIPNADHMLHALQPNLNLVGLASLSDNIAEVWKLAGQFLERRKDAKILVVGGEAASIGLYTALFIHQTKKGEIFYADTNKKRIDLANKLGIPVLEFENFPKPNLKFDLICDASASKEGWEFATRSMGKNAILSSASIFWTNKLEIPYLEMYNQGAEIFLGRVESKHSILSILPYIESGVFTPEKIVTQTAKFEDAKEAWMEESIKLVITR